MNKLLFRFFIISRKLSLPNIGTFTFQTEEAKDDLLNKTITPTWGKIIFTKENDEAAEERLKTFAQTKFEISPQETELYLQYLSQEFTNTHYLILDGLGILTQRQDQFEFEPSFSTAPFFPPMIIAKKIIRDPEEEDDEYYRSQSYWWIYVLIILIIAGACCAFYYFYFT